MSYLAETQHLIDAIVAGDCCDECSAPNDQRHMDECSKHPENIGEIADEWRRTIGPGAPLWLRRLINDTERFVRDTCAVPETVADALENEALREEIDTLTNERDAALLKVSELEDRVHDLEEMVQEPIEPWTGKATS